MAGFSPDKDRKIIPRWRTFSATIALGELDSGLPSRAHERFAAHFLASRISDWHTHRTVGHAADLVGTAVAIGKHAQAADAAHFLLQDDRSVSQWIRELAQRVISPQQAEKGFDVAQQAESTILRTQVKTFRQWLRDEPRDPITWVDLARVYAALGFRKRAATCMTIALQLAAGNRFILRSASRLWIHLDDPERAHDTIVRAQTTRFDPWLLAAEIATSDASGKSSRFVKIARQMLSDRSHPAGHLSELASAIATLELDSGNIRKSRRLFDQSLENPTENSIAQAEWASRRGLGIHFDDHYLDVANTFEARSWTYSRRGDWSQTTSECWNWQVDQPFSSRPCIQGSYFSAVALEDYSECERFAERGLVANSTNFMLLNNLAFAYINSGKIEKAKNVLARIDDSRVTGREHAVIHATRGLLAFRTGDAIGGRRQYSEALRIARNLEDDQLIALASVFYAMEELASRMPGSDRVVTEARRDLQKLKDPLSGVLDDRLMEMANTRNADI